MGSNGVVLGLREWSARETLGLMVLVVGVFVLAGHTTRTSTTAMASDPATGSRFAPASVILLGHTSEQKAVVGDLVDRFTAAGLHLPPLTISFAPSREDCGGSAHGLYRGAGEIRVCVSSVRTLAHEMGHAWEAHSLTNVEREAYRRLWGAPTWDSHEFEWHQRAIELAANTIAFAILNEDRDPYQQMRGFLCTYEALTGLALPTPLDPPCQSADPRVEIPSAWWIPKN